MLAEDHSLHGACAPYGDGNTMMNERKPEHERQLVHWRRLVREAESRREIITINRHALLCLCQDLWDYGGLASHLPKLRELIGPWCNGYLGKKDMFIRNPHLDEPHNVAIKGWTIDSPTFHKQNTEYTITIEDLDLLLTTRDFYHDLVVKFCKPEWRIFTGYSLENDRDPFVAALEVRYMSQARLDEYNSVVEGGYHPRWNLETIIEHKYDPPFIRQVAEDIKGYGEYVTSARLIEWAEYLER